MDSSLVAVGSEDSYIRIWHKTRGELLSVIKEHSLVVNALAFSPKHKDLLVSVSDDTTIRLFGLTEETCQVNLGPSREPPSEEEEQA